MKFRVTPMRDRGVRIPTKELGNKYSVLGLEFFQLLAMDHGNASEHGPNLLGIRKIGVGHRAGAPSAAP